MKKKRLKGATVLVTVIVIVTTWECAREIHWAHELLRRTMTSRCAPRESPPVCELVSTHCGGPRATRTYCLTSHFYSSGKKTTPRVKLDRKCTFLFISPNSFILFMFCLTFACLVYANSRFEQLKLCCFQYSNVCTISIYSTHYEYRNSSILCNQTSDYNSHGSVVLVHCWRQQQCQGNQNNWFGSNMLLP